MRRWRRIGRILQVDLIGKVIGTDLQICGRSILVYLSLLEVPVVTIPGHLTLYSHV
jgi:hypothetical protein